MKKNQVNILCEFFSLGRRDMTRVEFDAMNIGFNALSGEIIDISNPNKFFDTLTLYSKTDIFNVMFAANAYISNRENLLDELAAFMPREIARAEFNPMIVLNGDERGVDEFIEDKVMPIFSDIKGCFFKLGGCSAKDVKASRVNSIADVKHAMMQSFRYKIDCHLQRLLKLPATMFFNEKIPGMETSKEIRVIVKDNKIKGISAYNIWGKIEYHKDFIPKCQKILQDQILPLAKKWQNKYVIDFAERAGGVPQVLEFNPYFASGMCLYGKPENVGKPPVIEEDIYGAAELIHKIMSDTDKKFAADIAAYGKGRSV
jgi:hypothetical protein